ncbi:GNAT family protein [Shouchella miscanthi]|uniref:GNAT family protein n=1 Tax=Shouchella miscanthi TaxID=2598861 RepID=A0ABU6NLS9_9BACI|nr:GNAT family protein [Shouchella miscanthi]
MDIRTDRVTIRTFLDDDWEEVYRYTSDAATMYYMPEGVLSKDETKQLILNNSGDGAKRFPVLLKKDQALIGHVVFHDYFGSHTFEIGWVFHPNYQNKGYASEAAYAILKYGFENLNLHRVIATCQPENVPSWRVMEKVGMRREGYFKKCIPHESGWWDEYYYAILKEEFEALDMVGAHVPKKE